MRPLVLPDPLPAQPDVFTLPDDDFLLLIADQSSLMSTAQSSLDSYVDQATDPANDIGADLDAIGACWDGVDQTFGKLNESFADLDYTLIIAQVAAIEDVFAAGVLGWALDINALTTDFLNQLVSIFSALTGPIYEEANEALQEADNAYIYAQLALNNPEPGAGQTYL